MSATTRTASSRVVTSEMSTLAGRPVSYTRPFNLPIFPAAPRRKIHTVRFCRSWALVPAVAVTHREV